MELKQFDTNLTRFTYKIEDTGIRLVKKGISSSAETFLDFENIGSKITHEKRKKLIWLFASILFLFIAIAVYYQRLNGGIVGSGAEIFHLTVSGILCMIFFLTKQNMLFLSQSDYTNAIEFIWTKRYKTRVDNFIKVLLERRNKYLVDKYSTLDELLPYSQQYNNLVWLYNLNLLTKEQMQAKISELNKIDFDNFHHNKSSSSKIVGFSNRTTEYDEDNKNEE